VLDFTSNSSVTVTVPTGLGAGCNIIVSQSGTGVVSFTASGTTLRQLAGTAATAGQYAKVFLYATTDSLWELSGQVAGSLAAGLSATLAENRFPALDGDVSNSAGDLTTALAAKFKTFIKSLTLLDPVAGDSGRVQLMFPTAVTITRVTCNTLTATSTATVNFEERGETTPGTTGTAVLSADLVADTNMQTSCASGCDVNTITNAGIAARVPLAFTISAVANAPAEVTCHIDGTVD
jgi:hypothetical protein